MLITAPVMQNYFYVRFHLSFPQDLDSSYARRVPLRFLRKSLPHLC